MQQKGASNFYDFLFFDVVDYQQPFATGKFPCFQCCKLQAIILL